MQNYPRLAGTLVPLFALRRAGDFGIGDTEALLKAIVFCSEQKMGLLQLLPVNETGDDNSPYNAISSVALDPVYLTLKPELIPGLTQDILQDLASEEVLQSLRAGSVRYREVKILKLEVLSHAFVNFEAEQWDAQTELAQELRGFIENNKAWLESYTLFRCLLNEYEGNAVWPSWQKEHQTFALAKAWLEHVPERLELERYRLFTAYLQWISWRQWTAVRYVADQYGVHLLGDIPFGVSRYSADVWAERELFDLDWSGGAPAEPFFSGDKFLRQWGQNWGIPLYQWNAHAAQNFAWWRQRVQETGSIFHGFRIDHVLGFFRIWSFPWMPQRNEAFLDLTLDQVRQKTGGHVPHFVPNPDTPEELSEANAQAGEALLQIIQEAAGSTLIVAEDLGMVPPYVPEVLDQLGIPGFAIPHFQRDPKTEELLPANDIAERSITSWGTHDHATLRAWYEDLTQRWKGPEGHSAWLELQRIMRFIGWDENAPPETFTPEIYHAFLDILLKTKSAWCVLTICDILDLNLRFNQPGTATDDNWSQRLDRPLSDYSDDPPFAAKLAAWRTMVVASGRAG